MQRSAHQNSYEIVERGYALENSDVVPKGKPLTPGDDGAGRAGLHAHKARRRRLEEREHLAAPKLLANDDLLGRVDAVSVQTVRADRSNCVFTAVDPVEAGFVVSLIASPRLSTEHRIGSDQRRGSP